jgi:hypothetical protein
MYKKEDFKNGKMDTQYTIGVEKDKKGNEHVVVLGKDVDLIELSGLLDK